MKKTPLFIIIVAMLALLLSRSMAMKPISDAEAQTIQGMECGTPEYEPSGPYCLDSGTYSDTCAATLNGTTFFCGYPIEVCDGLDGKKKVSGPIRDGKCLPDPLSSVCCKLIDAPCVTYNPITCATTPHPLGFCITYDDPVTGTAYHLEPWSSCTSTVLGTERPVGTRKMAVECL